MDDRNTNAVLEGAEVAERRTRSAGRWFPRYLALLGVIAIGWIVALEALFPEGAARGFASAAAAGAYLLAWRWAESHEVHPHGAARRVGLATALWFGTYLVLIGPFVRWKADNSLAAWTAAAVVMAAPFFVAAWLARRRS